MSYVIMKSTRIYYGGPGYRGLSCEAAGVEPGKIYVDKEAAQQAAEKLSAVNPVGFCVVEYRLPPSEYRPWLFAYVVPEGRASEEEERTFRVINKGVCRIYRASYARLNRLLLLTEYYLYRVYTTTDSSAIGEPFKVTWWDFRPKEQEDAGG